MTTTRPNILFFFPDQHRHDWIGVHGTVPVRTPHLDALAARGTRFTQAFTPSPLCSPARACLATGRDYGRCGVLNNNQNTPVELPNCYRALRTAGYHVGGVGKFDLHKPDHDWGLDGRNMTEAYGFTWGVDNEGKLDGSSSFQRSGTPQGPYLKALQEAGLAEAYVSEHRTRHEGDRMGAYTTVIPDNLYCDNWLCENGLAFLDTVPGGEPWFLQINFTGPHDPMDVTERMRKRWEAVAFAPPYDNNSSNREGLMRNRQNYAAMIENIDRQVGRFLARVKERGETENTVILYTSDHGEMLGDHSRWGKATWHNPSVRVPMVAAGPGVVSGKISDALVSLHDLSPTFTEMAGAEPLAGADARSLLPLLQGTEKTHRSVVHSALKNGQGMWACLFDGRYKMVNTVPGGSLLFDCLNDPMETTDCKADHPDVVARLQAEMDNHPAALLFG